MATLTTPFKKIPAERRGAHKVHSYITTDETRHAVDVPKGIKNRKMERFEFRFNKQTPRFAYQPYTLEETKAATQELADNLTITRGNSKLKKTAKAYGKRIGQKVEIIAFSTPALLACPFANDCESFCYALQGQFMRRSVLEPRARNLAVLRHIAEITKHPAQRGAVVMFKALHPHVKRTAKRGTKLVVRMHDSGDFFSPWYLEMWIEVANLLPEVEFYGFTKAIKMLQGVTLPPNMSLVQSVGGTQDKHIDEALSHSRVFASHEDRKAAGYVDGNDDVLGDIPAIVGDIRIGLVYHGTETLHKAA